MIRFLKRWLVRIVWLAWVVVMLLVGIKLVMDNQQEVQIALFSWLTPAVSLGVVVCLVLLCGVALGWLAGTGSYLSAKRGTRRLNKQLNQTRQEVANLRTLPLKD